MNIREIKIVELLVMALLGGMVMVIPVVMDPSSIRYDAKFLPLIRTAVEGFKFYSLGLIFILGVMAGILCKSPAWLLGLSTITIFPLWSLTDMAMGASHYLLAVEWAVYLFVGLCGVAGVVAGRIFRGYYRSRTIA